jgi:O-succinylbenzoic acid--CoA ligase
MTYPHHHIWINGRLVSLQSIVQQSATAKTKFEESTFSFLAAWLSSQDQFTTKTSGSTGEPKEITFSRSQMIASANATIKALDLNSSMTSLVCIDTKYIGGKMMLVRSIESGMKILAVEPSSSPLQKMPVDHCANFAAFVPYQIYSMLDSRHPHLLDTVDIGIIGGAPLNKNAIDKLQRYGSSFYLTYGMTETISHVALQKLNGDNRSSQFQFFDGVIGRADDRGCLVIECDYLPEPIITNDIVSFVNDDKFSVDGRYDNVINTGGVKVQPEKVEAALTAAFQQAGVDNKYFITGLPDEKLGSVVSLVIETKEPISPALEKKFPEIFSGLSIYEKPRQVFTSTSFSFTESGKINRVQSSKNISKALLLSDTANVLT